ncbi:uncharacterized protein L3040_004814 [Drepanopeziza brunnea f. sp. 'multigermtubi']|uniref:Uncharacterized protein n=1 Tax=Marssonina brunnea f. sp. multigermtubi (strain MB_m1) TaxID=1072389 RepID=K1XM41_MARBU|nr:uncharacterized protein MBM_00701 [Drepanopeziza brunnea f. sp. 'multigermtubi' MB_m1]EKD21588.1 hypothetical protein MBM_00701 [Drepanopeziza brunnea f. sp. 'multigermtubi' MB_m1]KAJ5042261.1 hypothetical protein L3040_004814 [Drepanopeziza brunnea f. sp. 'multigermtubi']
MAPSRDLRSPRAGSSSPPPIPPISSGRSARRPSAVVAPLNLGKIRKTRAEATQKQRPDPLALLRASHPPETRADHVDEHAAADEHSPAQSEMSLIDQEIREILEASHSELQSRLGNAVSTSEADAIRKHLEFATPPNSPANPGSPPLSPNSRRLRERLQCDTYQSLIASDGQLRLYLGNLQGMKEWWTANKKAWATRKSEYNTIQHQILYLLDQQDQLGQHDIYASQIKQQERELVPLAKWFVKNKLIMKQVWLNFKRLETATRTVSRGGPPAPQRPRSGLSWTRADRAPETFTYEVPPKNDDVRTFPWYRTGLEFWVTPALAELTQRKRALQQDRANNLEIQDRSNEIIRGLEREIRSHERLCNDRDEMVQNQVHVLRQARAAGYRDDVETLEGHRSREMEQEAEHHRELKSLLLAQQTKSYESYINNDTIVDHQSRNDLVVKILKWMSDLAATTRYREDIPEEVNHPQSINYIYKTCFFHDRKSTLLARLDDLVVEGDLSVQQRSEIFELLAAHHESISVYNPWLVTAKDPSRYSKDDFRDLGNLFQKECDDFESFLARARKIGEGKDVPTKLPRERHGERIPRTTIQSMLGPVAPMFGSKMALEDAIRLLEERPMIPTAPMIGEGRFGESPDNWATLLAQFFTSPDIFPLLDVFHPDDCAGWTRAEFSKLVNDRLSFSPGLSPLVPKKVLEAFLVYSHRAGQLFRISPITGKVFLVPDGWETCTEQGVQGPPRRLPFALSRRPPGIHDAEGIIRRWMYRLCVERGSRITAATLLEEIRTKMVQPLPAEVFQTYLCDWFLYGRFFVSSGSDSTAEMRKPLSAQLLIMVENGWDLPRTWDLAPLKSRGLTPAKWARIRNDTLRADLPGLLSGRGRGDQRAADEAEVYHVVYGAALRCDVTRHDFHLFLRLCNEREELLRLGRDGKVAILGHHWDADVWPAWMRANQ